MGAAVILGNWLGPRISTYLIPVTRALDLIRLVAYHVPFGWPRRPQQTSFAPGEDPVRYVMEEVGSVYPRINQSWPDKTSDEALAHFCRCGVAAHRTELATAAEQGRVKHISINYLAPINRCKPSVLGRWRTTKRSSNMKCLPMVTSAFPMLGKF